MNAKNPKLPKILKSFIVRDPFRGAAVKASDEKGNFRSKLNTIYNVQHSNIPRVLGMSAPAQNQPNLD